MRLIIDVAADGNARLHAPPGADPAAVINALANLIAAVAARQARPPEPAIEIATEAQIPPANARRLNAR